MLPAMQLSAIPSIDKQLDIPHKRLDTARKTTRTATQTRQIMTQFGIHPFHPIGLMLVRHWRVYARMVNQASVSSHQITVVPSSLRTLINQALQDRLISSPTHPKTHNTTAVSLNQSDYAPSIFFARQKCTTHPFQRYARDFHQVSQPATADRHGL